MNDGVMFGSGVMIRIRSFVETGLGVQNLVKGIHRHRDMYVFHDKGNRLKTNPVREMYKCLCANYVLERNT
jgi:hypothetical protein